MPIPVEQQYTSISDWLLSTATPSGGRRSPPYWSANGAFGIPPVAIVGGQGYVQVLGQRPGRHTFVVINTGANAATISDRQNPQVPGVPLAVGGQWSIDTEGELYAASTLGTILTVLETYWPIVLDYRTPGGALPDFSTLVP